MRLVKRLATNVVTRDFAGMTFDGSKMDVICAPHRSWPLHGVILQDEALLLDYKTFTSFRVKSGNLGYLKRVSIFKHPYNMDKIRLAQYFAENQDNPYALQHVMAMVAHREPLNNLTQYPPLRNCYTNEEDWYAALARLEGLAQEGDLLFSGVSRDPISAIVRKYDRCQFSHSAVCVGKGEVLDVTLQGGCISKICANTPPTRLALYRGNQELTLEQRNAIAAKGREWAQKGVRYSLKKVALCFLRKRFRLPVARNIPTNANLLSRNELRLVAYV